MIPEVPRWIARTSSAAGMMRLASLPRHSYDMISEICQDLIIQW